MGHVLLILERKAARDAYIRILRHMTRLCCGAGQEHCFFRVLLSTRSPLSGGIIEMVIVHFDRKCKSRMPSRTAVDTIAHGPTDTWCVQ